jgi:hypothetical protein
VRAAVSTPPRSARELVKKMTAVPTSAAGRHTAANDSIPMSTPCSWAIPAINRFELDPISVTDPARVVM